MTFPCHSSATCQECTPNRLNAIGQVMLHSSSLRSTKTKDTARFLCYFRLSAQRTWNQDALLRVRPECALLFQLCCVALYLCHAALYFRRNTGIENIRQMARFRCYLNLRVRCM